MRDVMHDLTYATKYLLRNPIWAALVAVVLGLGLAANVSVFSVISEVLLRPLPFDHPDQLVILFERPPGGGEADRALVAPPTFLDWSTNNHIFVGMAALEPSVFSFVGRGEPQNLSVNLVSPNIFKLLGVAPLRGRTFSTDVGRAGNDGEVLLGESFWRSRFSADPNVLGTTLVLDQKNYTITGVVPSGPFQLPPFEDADIWVPLPLTTSNDRRGRSAYVIGRLEPSLTIRQAQIAMNALVERTSELYPQTNKDWGVTVVSMKRFIVGDVERPLTMLMGSVIFVLLISCTNVANLILARGLDREKDLSIRALLGASSWRLIRQLLAEGLLVSFSGSLVGLLLAEGGISLVRRLVPSAVPHIGNFHLDAGTLLFALTLSLFSALVFGLVPALRILRRDINRSSGRRYLTPIIVTDRKRRRRSLVIIGELALCSTLFVGAGLMIQTFLHLRSVKPGFDANDLLTMLMVPDPQRYKPSDRINSFYEEALDRVSRLPGVKAVALVNSLPLQKLNFSTSMNTSRTQEGVPSASATANILFVSPHYFEAFGIPIINGREFDARDSTKGSQSVVLSESVARELWPHENPIGKYATLHFGGPKPVEIIGVVGDMRQMGITEAVTPQVYLPFFRFSRPFMYLAVRTYSDPLPLIPTVKQEIWRIDDRLPLSDVSTMGELLSAEFAQAEFYTSLLSVFAAIAVALAAAGVLGVVAHSVAMRTKEIGIRLALGARPSDILSMVIRESLISAGVGVGLGALASVFLTKALSNLLFGISRYDSITFVLMALALLGVALCASYFPARRAMLVDPGVALRYE